MEKMRRRKKWIDFVARSRGVLSYEWPVRAAAFTEDSAFVSGGVWSRKES